LLARGVPVGPNALVTVTGRTSGQPRTVPLAIIDVAGRHWVWSPWGDVQWVRNLRAAGAASIEQGGRRWTVDATELDAAERVTFFRDILGPFARSMRGGTRFLRLVDGVDISDPVAAAQGRTVFELMPRG
jgi:deazaflavin-dependent oxidoreductase (nitroreductase family)